MGRRNKYETHVLPKLDKVKEWVSDYTERDIAKMLGITQQSFENYKKAYPELQEALRKGKEELILDLRNTLKRKAKGYTYTETKTVTREENGKKTTVIEKYEKYAQPDTGAIHLLLKNLDPTWRNDDAQTMELKRRQVELAEKKAEDEF
jgi:hypothetical protein